MENRFSRQTPKSIHRILFLIFCIFGLNFIVNAQFDCRYGLQIYIFDEKGKPIENAKHEIFGVNKNDALPSYIKLYKLDGVYYVIGDADTKIKGDFLLKISVEGFDVFEQKFNFSECEVQRFTLKLKPKGSNALTRFERFSILTGTVLDPLGSVVPNAKVTAINLKGDKYETITDDEGIYVLNLPVTKYETSTIGFNDIQRKPLAKYQIEAESAAFKKTVIKDFVFVPAFSGKMKLDLVLELKESQSSGDYQ